MSTFLEIYLQDHYAGSTGGLEMAKRTANENAGTEFGGPLTRITGEIDEDRDALKRIMDRLDVSPAPVKATLAWAAEKAGRVKPNGQLRRLLPARPRRRDRGAHHRRQRQAQPVARAQADRAE